MLIVNGKIVTMEECNQEIGSVEEQGGNKNVRSKILVIEKGYVRITGMYIEEVGAMNIFFKINVNNLSFR